jgi:hypothetical protein
MAMHWNAIRSMARLVVGWGRVLSDRPRILFGSFPNVLGAFGASDLPLSFVLRHASDQPKAGNGKRHSAPTPVPKGMGRVSSIHLAGDRPHVRSALPRKADAPKRHRVA